MNHTHKITNMGKTFLVRQTAPGLAVDDAGSEWPLRIAPGQRGYQIKAIGKKAPKKEIRDAFADDMKALNEELGKIR